MKDANMLRVPVWPYVAAGAVVRIIIGALGAWYYSVSGNEVPNIGAGVTILAAGVGVAWYSHVVNRPMQRAELLRFATGATLVDAFLSALIIVGPILWVGESLSVRNLDLVLGGDGTHLTQSDLLPLVGLMLFTMIVVFGLSYFFARLITRKLPRGSRTTAR